MLLCNTRVVRVLSSPSKLRTSEGSSSGTCSTVENGHPNTPEIERQADQTDALAFLRITSSQLSARIAATPASLVDHFTMAVRSDNSADCVLVSVGDWAWKLLWWVQRFCVELGDADAVKDSKLRPCTVISRPNDTGWRLRPSCR